MLSNKRINPNTGYLGIKELISCKNILIGIYISEVYTSKKKKKNFINF